MIDVANESGIEVPGLAERDIAACATYALRAMHVHPLADLSVLLVDTAAIAALHGRWLDDPAPTDVMSSRWMNSVPALRGFPLVPVSWVMSWYAQRWPPFRPSARDIRRPKKYCY